MEMYIDCKKCDACEAVEVTEDYDQGTISVDGDEITFTIDAGQCEECGADHEVTVYAKVHTVECDLA